jgi:hypothetical protein
MINKLKNWFSKLVSTKVIEKKQSCELCCNYEEYTDDDDNECRDVCDRDICNSCRDEEEDYDDTVAYFHIAVSKDDKLIVEGDFREGHDADMSKLVFLINAGALSDFVAEVVYNRCGEDGEQTNTILKEAYRMIAEYLEKQECDENEDGEPVVDPCNVFSPRNSNENEEDE